MVYCAAYECNNTSNKGRKKNGVHFFSFPKNKKIKSLWLNKIKRIHFNPDKQHSSKLCSDHFHPSSFTRNPTICQQLNYKLYLKPDAVPTLFNHGHEAIKPITLGLLLVLQIKMILQVT